MNIKRFTGDYYFKPGRKGGFEIYIEVVYTTTHPITCDESPEVTKFIKANEEMLAKFKLVLKGNG